MRSFLISGASLDELLEIATKPGVSLWAIALKQR
jgi:hypothetical protein